MTTKRKRCDDGPVPGTLVRGSGRLYQTASGCVRLEFILDTMAYTSSRKILPAGGSAFLTRRTSGGPRRATGVLAAGTGRGYRFEFSVSGGRRNKMPWKITPEKIIAHGIEGDREGLTVNAILAGDGFVDY